MEVCFIWEELLYLHQKTIIMESTIRSRMEFSLSTGLIERLKRAAKRERCSLDNYVESVLLDAVYNEPNSATIEALEEVKRGEYAGVVDLTSIESMTKSILG